MFFSLLCIVVFYFRVNEETETTATDAEPCLIISDCKITKTFSFHKIYHFFFEICLIFSGCLFVQST